MCVKQRRFYIKIDETEDVILPKHIKYAQLFLRDHNAR